MKQAFEPVQPHQHRQRPFERHLPALWYVPVPHRGSQGMGGSVVLPGKLHTLGVGIVAHDAFT